MSRLRRVGNGLFWGMAVLGMTDLIVSGATDGRIHVIHSILGLFFEPGCLG